MLDPGHGGTDISFKATEYECYYNMKVASYCKQRLESDGRFKVYLTHDDNSQTLSLMERAMIANDCNADIVISIHFDSNPVESLHGLSAYVSVIDKYQKRDLAQKILAKLDEKTGLGLFSRPVQAVPDRGDDLYYWSDEYNWSFPNDPSVGPLRDYYGILKWCAYFGMPAVIVEHGFLSNPYDLSVIDGNEEVYKALGEGDAEALIEYYAGHKHVFQGETRDFPSNCVMEGKYSEHCCICYARRSTRTLPLGDHYYVETENTKATCESDGHRKCLCEFTRAMNVGLEGYIEDHITDEITPASGHDYKLTGQKEPAHGKDGYKKFRCNNCGKEYTEVLPGEAHTFEEKGSFLPDCENDGYILYVCGICGEEKKVISEKSPGHSFALLSTLPPDCENDGYDIYECSVCKKQRKAPIKAKGHDGELLFVSDGGCKGSVTETYECRVCKKIYSADSGTAGSHSAARDNESGFLVCSVCGEKLPVIFPEKKEAAFPVSLPSPSEPAGDEPPETALPETTEGDNDSASESETGSEDAFYPLPGLDRVKLLIGEIAAVFVAFILLVVFFKLKKNKKDPFVDTDEKEAPEETEVQPTENADGGTSENAEKNEDGSSEEKKKSE